MSLSSDQITELLKPIDPSRVSRDGKGFSHVEAWDIRRTMNQIFGFALWSSRVDQMELIYEVEIAGDKPRWSVAYRARCTIELGDFMEGSATYSEWAAGDATNYPSRADAHDQAIKTAESQAFKRCAVNLGDQFGLSLYRNGSTDATVGDVIGFEHEDSEKVDDLVSAFDDAASLSDLDFLSQEISRMDLGKADKELLRSAYMGAKTRIDAI